MGDYEIKPPIYETLIEKKNAYVLVVHARNWNHVLFSLFSMTHLENAKNVVLSRRRLLMNMTNGVKLPYYRGNIKT